MRELEAKYLLASAREPKRVLHDLVQQLFWAGYLTRPAGRHRIRDAYYDTADQQLHQAGWSLRVRSADGEYKCTFKEIAVPTLGVYQRREIEQHGFGDRPDINDLEPGPVYDLLRDILGDDKVSPLRLMFKLKTERVAYHLTHSEHPRSLIELAVDDVRIRADESVWFKELEFELKQGSGNALAELAAMLNHQPDLLPARMSKYQRGLLAGNHLSLLHSTTGASGSTLAPRSSWVELAMVHLHTQLRRLRHFEPYAWESVHPEGVHQMRIVTRRLQALLELMDGVLPSPVIRGLRKDVRWLGRALGQVRDFDVQLEQHSELKSQLRKNLNGYGRHLAFNKWKVQKKLVDVLDGSRYRTLVRTLGQLPEIVSEHTSSGGEPTIADATRDVVLPLLRGVRKRGNRIDRHSPDKKLHELRKELKHLRYQLDYLTPPGTKIIPESPKSLGRLQRVLGNHQDACMAAWRLKSFSSVHDLKNSQRRAFKKLRRHEAHRAEVSRRKFADVWTQFDREAGGLEKTIETLPRS